MFHHIVFLVFCMKSMKIKDSSKEKLRNTLYFILSSILIILPAIWNRFPLVFFDTGSYIHSGFTLDQPPDRPIGYGLFMRIVSWKASLWLVVIFQAILINFLLLRSLKLFLPKEKIRLYHLPGVLMLSVFTGMGWYSSQIMPDIFTAVLGLSVLNLLFDKRSGFIELLTFSMIIFMALISHYSHLVINILFLLIAFIFFYGYLKKNIRFFFLKAGLLFSLIILSILFLAFYNYKSDKGFVVSHSSHVYFNARLYGSGILKKYLDENCEKEPCFLCRYKNELPDAQFKMLWSDESPIKKKGLTWMEANQEFEKINKRILSKPKYLLLFVFESLKSSVVQLTQVNVGSGLFPYIEGSSPYFNIKKYREADFIPYATSRQNWDQLDFRAVNHVNYLLHLSAILLFYVVFRYKLVNQRLSVFIWLLIIYVISNAIATATLSNVYDRTQARVSWLIIFAIIPCIPGLINTFNEKLKRN